MCFVVIFRNIFLPQAIRPDTTDPPVWNLSLVELMTVVSTVPDEAKRNKLLNEMNLIISRISTAPLVPNENSLYRIA